MPVIKLGEIYEAELGTARNSLIIISRAHTRGPIPMTTIVEGIYKQGKIELLEPPPGLPEGRVRVIIIPEGEQPSPPRLLTFGMYPGDVSTLQDFKDAEWRGEEEWGDGHGQ